MEEEEEEQQAPDETPDIRRHFSRSVRDVGDEVGWGRVTSWRIVHILLRNHADYGGASLLPLDQNTGRIQPMDSWLEEVAEHFDLDAVAANKREVIDGRMTIIGLTLVDVELAAALELGGLRNRLFEHLGPELNQVLRTTGVDGDPPPEPVPWSPPGSDGSALEPPPPQTLTGHEAPVNSVALGRLGERELIVSGGDDGTVRFWGADGGPLEILTGHEGSVRSVAIGRLGERELIASGGDDGTIRFWGADGGPLEILSGHEGSVHSVALGRLGGRDVIVSGGSDHAVRVWAADGVALRTLTGHEDWVLAVALGRFGDREMIVSGGRDASVRFWAADGTPLQTFTDPEDWVRSVALGRLGEREVTVSGSDDDSLRVWDTDGGLLRIRSGHARRVHSVAIGRLADQDVIVSGGSDRDVRVWAADGGLLATLTGNERWVFGVALGRLGGRDVVVSGGEDRTVRIWPMTPTEAEDGQDDQQDAIELVGDLAATEDELGRAPIAHDLGRRLARIHHDDDRQQGSFLVHLDGPWGAGKSSILNFLRDDLEGRGPEPREPAWLVVDFNAWRERRARPPWRALLASLRAAVRSELTLLGRARFWFAELRRRVSQIGATGLIAAILLIAAVAALVLAWVSGGLTTVAVLVTTAATLVALVIAAARASGRFLFWGSERSAETFEETEEKPMQRLADHFSWLIQLVGEERLRRRPWTTKARLPTHRSEPSASRVHHSRATIFFIDDLDRCQAEHVVELMEAVQNLIRDAGSGRGPYFVVAADGRWIRRSYESSFERFGETVAEAGRPLGYLFLDKLFQMSVQVPSMTGGDQDGFMGRLLGVGAEDIAPPGTPVQQPPSKEEVLQKVEAGATEENFTAAVSMAEALPAAERQEVVARVVEREAETGQAKKTAHRLQPYARHLPPNPRTMKRFINAYEIARAVDRVEGRAVTPEKRAIWTVLRLRWPVLADHLQGDPELLDAIESVDPANEDLTVRLLAGGDVRRLLVEAKGAPFTASDLRACCGVEEPLVLPVASASSSVPA